MTLLPYSTKQLEFIQNANAKWNIAHGSVRTGKTVGTLHSFLLKVNTCVDSQIYMAGHTSETIFRNAVRLILESPELLVFRPFCTWNSSKRQLLFKDKVIQTLGAKDEGAIGLFQGLSMRLFYGDEMTLFPESIIDMVNTRLSFPDSQAIVTTNPSHPEHKIKQWIDKAEAGDKDYYSLHFTLEDNPFVDEDYKNRLKNSLSGVFYKRYFLGLWCLAEGAVFDFFDESIYVVDRPPTAAEYYILGVDYGTVNPFCALLIGVNSGRATQKGVQLWVESEYYWDPSVKGRQKVNAEYVRDVQAWLGNTPIKTVYLDPSAESFQLEMQRAGFHVVHAKNEVIPGIQTLSSEMQKGKVLILQDCKNTIREVQGYVWDLKKAQKGIDEPLKKNDHACDALRYAVASHKVSTFDVEDYYRKTEQQLRQKYQPDGFGYQRMK